MITSFGVRNLSFTSYVKDKLNVPPPPSNILELMQNITTTVHGADEATIFKEFIRNLIVEFMSAERGKVPILST